MIFSLILLAKDITILKGTIVKWIRFVFFSSLFFITHKGWSDDIWFTFPSDGQPVSGLIEIKIYPPSFDTEVRIWIESDKSEDIVWMGILTKEYNYTTTVDTSRFIPGKYEINAVYYQYGEDFEGDIDIWVNSF